jgi:hypothetical protein
MPQSEKIHARIQSLDERLARLRMKKGRLLARAGQTERKRDTRRKILIGGAVLAAVGREGVPPLRTSHDLLQWLDTQLTRPPDREAFDWTAEPVQTAESRSAPMSEPVRSEAAVNDADHREAPRSGAQRR